MVKLYNVMNKCLKKTGIIVTLIIFQFCTACGNNEQPLINSNESEKPHITTSSVDEKDLIFSRDVIDLSEVRGEPSGFMSAGNHIYFYTNEQAYTSGSENLTDNKPVAGIYTMYPDGTDIRKVCEPLLDDGESIYSILKIDEDIVTLVTDKPSTSGFTYNIVTLDNTGHVSLRNDITDKLSLDPDDFITHIIMNDSSDFIISTDKNIIVLDENYNDIFDIKISGLFFQGIARTPDDTVICCFSDEKGVSVQALDITNKGLGEKIYLDTSFMGNSDFLMNGNSGYDFYCKDDSGVYGCSLANGNLSKIVDYMASGISISDTYGLIPVNDTMILGTSSDMTGLTVTLYQKSDSSLSSDKTTITLGCMRGVDDNLQRSAIAFNEENESYQIDFVDYSQYEDPYTKINVDITTGKAPDIIDLSYLPVRQYAEKGVLEDLTPYYENDDDIGIELLIPSVAKAMQIDGAYYYVSPGFAINTLVAAADDVGGKTGWTFDDMQTLLENKGKDTRPFFAEHKDEILYNLLWASVDDYIDWNTGTCSFESDDFKSMLEISNLGKTGKADYDDGSPMDPQLLKDGKVLFDTYSSGKASSIQEYEKMYGRDIALIGYPNQEKNGSYFRFDEYVMLSIYSKSKLKDGAWEFVKTFMTRDYQINENNY